MRIGLLVPEIASFFSVNILDGIENILKAKGYQVILGCSHENLDAEKEQVAIFNYQQIDGLIMFPAPGDHSYLNEMPRKYPIVFLDRSAENCERDLFVGENEKTSYELVNQMIRDGHRNIGVILGKEGVSAIVKRLDGYKRALEDNHIPFEPEFVQNGNSTSGGGYRAAERLLKQGKVTAILSLSPVMTIGCMDCLIQHEVKVPQEIALVSFGESEWAGITNPPLTTVTHPLLKMGELAAWKLLERLEEAENAKEGEHKPYEIVRLPMELIRRSSY